MKRYFNFIILASFLCTGFFSCKDDTDDDEKTEPEVKNEIKNVLSDEFVLDNQYGLNTFFYAKEMKVVTNGEFKFDFAFAYYDTVRTFNNATSLESSYNYESSTTESYPKYFIAGGTSVDLIQLTNRELSSRRTTFYVLPDDFTPERFDTLKTVPGLTQVFESAKILRNKLDKSSDIYFSNGFGWTEGTLIGFKTEENKCGIIKIISVPYKYDRRKVGQLEIAVKFEGE